MATDYSEFVTLAQELIAENGREITFQKLQKTPADSSKPWKGAGEPIITQSVTDVFGVFVPASGSNLGRSLVNEELLKKVEQVVLVAGREEDLEGFQLILDEDSAQWRIEWAQTLRPASVTVLYVFGVCR